MLQNLVRLPAGCQCSKIGCLASRSLSQVYLSIVYFSTRVWSEKGDKCIYALARHSCHRATPEAGMKSRFSSSSRSQQRW